MLNIIEAPAKRKRKDFVFIPRAILANPPICNHNITGSKRPNDVTPFEFAIAMAVIVEARRVLGHNRHLDSLKKGKAAIALEGQQADIFKERWSDNKQWKREGENVLAPKRQHTFPYEAHYDKVNDGVSKYKQKSLYKPISRRKSIKIAGKHGYIKGQIRNRRKPPPNSITVELSVYALLRTAYLSKGITKERVEAALDRLCRFVGKMPAVLHSWERTETNALRLNVNGAWLEPPYAPAPLPSPIRSFTALALLLFLANYATLYKFGVSQEKLCYVLGVSHIKNIKNILVQALHVIHGLLDQHPSSTLKSAKFPGCFEVFELDGKMQFKRVHRQEHEEYTDENEQENKMVYNIEKNDV